MSTPPGFFTNIVKAKAGPFIGSRGGKWADPQHKIPWDDKKHAHIQAGIAHGKEAEAHTKAGRHTEAATSHKEAGKAFRAAMEAGETGALSAATYHERKAKAAREAHLGKARSRDSHGPGRPR